MLSRVRPVSRAVERQMLYRPQSLQLWQPWTMSCIHHHQASSTSSTRSFAVVAGSQWYHQQYYPPTCAQATCTTTGHVPTTSWRMVSYSSYSSSSPSTAMRPFTRRGFTHTTRIQQQSETENNTPPAASVKLPETAPRPHLGKPPMPRKLGRVKVPTPEKALPPEAKPGGLFKMFDPQKLALQTLKLTRTLVVTLATYAYKTPYWTWYYATHAKERSEMITRLKDMARHEAQHYWNGTKLLVADVRTARTLLRKTLDGNALTRRERKQLLRTVSDLFRLVPFSMFVIIPFMEFALPFALRIFPNLLPSTFQDSLKAEETMKRELQSRIAMAQFFQDTLETLAKEQKKKAVRRRQEMEQAGDDPADVDSMIHKQEDSAASMLEFLSKARNGEMIPPDVIIRYAKYFQDDLTLDNMPRMQLINMCRYMNIPPYGADSFLRFQLRHRIRSLKEDDQRILWEGIESLTKMELREAVQERGMRSTGLSKDAYKRALQQWLDLSVNKNVPIALLIMSRTFFLQDEIPPMPPPPQAAKESAKGETDAKAASKTSAPAKEPKKTEDKAHTAETKDSSVTTDTEGTAKSDAALTGLADAISGLDKQVLNEVILNLATSEEKISDPEIRKLKLEVLQKQNELIQREEQDREEAKKQKAMSASESSEAASTDSTVSETTTPPSASPEPQPAETPLQALDGTLTTEEMDALRAILTDDPVSTEREALERIKSSMKEDISPDQREEQHGRSESREGHAKVASDGTPVGKEDTLQGAVAEGKKSSAPMTPAEADSYVSEQIREQERAAASMSDSSAATEFSTQSEKPGETARTAVDTEEKEEEAEDSEPDDPIVARLKKRIESMVDKIELQLTETEVKIGDKMHFLDKDRDGILSREEVAEVLQQVFKKNLSFDEAMEIASEIDDNHDGVFTVDELLRWIDEHRLVRFVEEGRDIDLDKLMDNKGATESQQQEKINHESGEAKSSQ